MKKRCDKLIAKLREKNIDAAIITSPVNRRYFSGFTGSNGYLIVTDTEAKLITDPRYTAQAQLQTTKDCQVIEYLYDRLGTVAKTVKAMGITALVLESSLTLDEYLPLKEQLGDMPLHYEQEYFLEQRMVKDAEEIACTKAAITAAEAGFDKLLPRLKIGMTEKDVADELHYLVSKEGAEAMSFGTIVGSGPRGALAHAFPTEKKIENGDMVVVDFGVMKDGYCSDMTRTVAVGEPTEVMYEMIEVVNAILPKDKPRYLMGVGTPQNLLEGIERGVDMFDCVMPTRNGRNAMLFSYEGTMNMRNKKWEADFSPLDPTGCEIDRITSKAYLHHLFKAGELLAMQIASIHNLAFYLRLVTDARAHILQGDFTQWKSSVIDQLGRRI